MADALARVTELSEEDFERGRGSLKRRALTRLKRLVIDNRGEMARLREAARRNEHFYSPLGSQWPSDVKALYKKLRIPAKGLNETWKVVHSVTGHESTNRFKPKFLGADPEDQKLADAFNAAMQRERQRGGFEGVTSHVFRQAAVQRVGVARFIVDLWSRRRAELKMRRLRLDQAMIEFSGDQPNYADMTAIAHGRWETLEEFVEFNPEPEAEDLFADLDKGGTGPVADFDDGDDSDAWSTTVGEYDGVTTAQIPYRRSTKQIFVVEVEWKERELAWEIEIPGETAELWKRTFQAEQESPKGLPDDEDLRDMPQALEAVGMLAAQAQFQLQQMLEQFQQQAIAYQQATEQGAQGLQPPQQPHVMPVIIRQVNRAGMLAFQTGFAAAAGKQHGRIWRLKVPRIYQATIVGDRVIKASRRPDNYWSMIPLVCFLMDAERGSRPYSLLDVLYPRQVWLNMFVSVWMHAMAHMPKAQFGLDLDKMDVTDVAKVNTQITKGSRAIGVKGGKDAVFDLPKGQMPDGVESAMQLFLQMVPAAAGQEGNQPISGDLRRIAAQLVTHQLETSNKILGEAFSALKDFRRAEALKFAHVVCGYWSYEEFRKAAGKYGDAVPEDRSQWWRFLDLDLVVTEEPSTRDTATAAMEALNQTALWTAFWQTNPEGIVELMTPMIGSSIAESTLNKLRQMEPQVLMQKLAQLTGVDPAVIQAAVQQGQQQGAQPNA